MAPNEVVASNDGRPFAAAVAKPCASIASKFSASKGCWVGLELEISPLTDTAPSDETSAAAAEPSASSAPAATSCEPAAAAFAPPGGSSAALASSLALRCSPALFIICARVVWGGLGPARDPPLWRHSGEGGRGHLRAPPIHVLVRGGGGHSQRTTNGRSSRLPPQSTRRAPGRALRGYTPSFLAQI